MTGPQTCPRCGGAVEPDRDVEELVREGDDVAVVRVCADVCGECGEALFHASSVERLLDARQALRRAAPSSAPVIGRVYDYRSAG